MVQVRTILKLSSLPDYVEVSALDSGTVYTVKELKDEILRLGEPHHLTKGWHLIERKRWNPSAANMVESYIDSEYCEMYENWDERANDCMTKEVIQKIQDVLDEAFKGDHATAYWSYEEPIEIDILPPEDKEAAKE
jgi:uncharacterized protein YdaL